MPTAPDPCVREALRILGVRRLFVALHDACLPSSPSEDTGRGTPYGEGAFDFFEFAAELGFSGVQLGPPGEVSLDNFSPYDSTAFSRSTVAISLAALARDARWGGIVAADDLDAIVQRSPRNRHRVAHGFAHREQRRALAVAWDAFRRSGAPVHRALRAELAGFRDANAAWLERDGLFETLAVLHGTEDWSLWDGADDGSLDSRLWSPRPGEEAAVAALRRALVRERAADLERHAFLQFVVHEQHRELRARMRSLGLELWGDLQIGYAHRDRWALDARFLRGWLLGAPPSRTNPAGQAWGYPILDPDQYFVAGEPEAESARSSGVGDDDAGVASRRRRGPALELVRARLDKMFAEYDGVRIDHPHGLVCPWVYRADTPDPHAEVGRGARLFDSPDHPALARFAIARKDQLARDPGVARHADDWVRELDPDQVDRYAFLLDEVVNAARAAGRSSSNLACEVLSTCPYPLGLVLQRHGLGRFRVTQKANLDDPTDVYRTENAAREDWVMLGTHDTKPIWCLIDEWRKSGEISRQATFLARRMRPNAHDSDALAQALAADPGALAHAKFAELFASPAENAMVFFSDLLGIAEVFNRPGVASAENWSLRIPPDYRDDYRARVGRGLALDLPRALALAIGARGEEFAARHRGLSERLAESSAALRSEN